MMTPLKMPRARNRDTALFVGIVVLAAILVGIVGGSGRLGIELGMAVAGLVGLTFGLMAALGTWRESLSVEKAVLYLCVVAGFTGPAFLCTDIGPFSLFPFRVLLLLMWVLFLLGIVTNRSGLWTSDIRVATYLCFFAAWAAYSILSLAWAADRVSAIRYSLFLLMGVSLIYFVVLYLSSLRDLKRLYVVWMAVLVVFVGLGLWNHLTGRQLVTSRYVDALDSFHRTLPTAVFYNTNDFATYLALSVAFVLAYLRYGRGLIRRALCLAILFLCLLLVTYSNCRASLLGIAAGVLFFLLLLAGGERKVKILMLVSLLVVVLLVFLPHWTVTIPGNPQSQLATILHEAQPTLEGEPTSLLSRLNLVKNCIVFAADSGGFGVGAGNAEHYMLTSPVYYTQGITNPHNWWAEILADYGIVIFVGYVAVCLRMLMRLYGVHRSLSDGPEKMICEALMVGSVIFFFASMGSSSIMDIGTQWVFVALTLAFLNYWRIRQEESRTSGFPSRAMGC